MIEQKSILHKSFGHGWWYHYRIHEPKARSLCANGLSSLKKYLYDVHKSCPDEYFLKGPRGSALRMKFDLDIKQINGHEVSSLAQNGLEADRFKTAHTNVQMFMLQHDDKTISIEVPLWMLEQEFLGYSELFGSKEALTGHIDALRVEDNKIWIWDYKPKAHKEKYASTQVLFYALMLSQRSGIPMDRFRCGYFDENTAFIFKPPKPDLLKSKLI